MGPEEVVWWPIAVVQIERITQESRKVKASQPVIFFKTSAVEAPNKESLESPPNEAPNPELLLSWIRITKHKMAQSVINKMMAKI